jgi:hypothetical protein
VTQHVGPGEGVHASKRVQGLTAPWNLVSFWARMASGSAGRLQTLDRWPLQGAEGFRERALEGARVITYLREFAAAADMEELSELFQDDNRLAEAAVRVPSPACSSLPAVVCPRSDRRGCLEIFPSLCMLHACRSISCWCIRRYLHARPIPAQSCQDG